MRARVCVGAWSHPCILRVKSVRSVLLIVCRSKAATIADLFPPPPFSPGRTDGFASSTAVLIILCDRPDYLKRTLDQLMKLRPQRGFPVFASQDCLSSSKSSEIADLIKDYPSVTHLRVRARVSCGVLVFCDCMRVLAHF